MVEEMQHMSPDERKILWDSGTRLSYPDNPVHSIGKYYDALF